MQNTFKIKNVFQGDTVYYSELLNLYIYHEKHPYKDYYMTHLCDSEGEVLSAHNSVQEAIKEANSINHYLNVVHYIPSDETNNVACLNGSAYLKTSIDLNQVTCQKCLDNVNKGLTWFKNCNYKIR